MKDDQVRYPVQVRDSVQVKDPIQVREIPVQSEDRSEDFFRRDG